MREIKCWAWRDLAADDSLPENEFLVEGLIGKEEFTLLTATAKTGKTWFALNLALSVASGQSFLGRYLCKEGRVLLLQTEVGIAQFRDRILNFGEHHPLGELVKDNLILCNERLKIDSEEGVRELDHLIETHKPALLILDPLYTLHRKDENIAKDMVPIMVDLKSLVMKHSVAILLVHHEGKRQEGGGSRTVFRSRGSSALADVPDNLWSLCRSGLNVLTLSIEARNVAAPEKPLKFALQGENAFKLVEGGNESRGTVSDLIQLIPAEGQIAKADLIPAIFEAFNFRQRKAENLIAEAISLGKIERVFEGKGAAYRHARSRSQDRIDLEPYEHANGQKDDARQDDPHAFVDVGF